MLQAGITVIGDDVEIQANSCVDRATVGETRIGKGAKLDDLVLVGHGGAVGENAAAAALRAGGSRWHHARGQQLHPWRAGGLLGSSHRGRRRDDLGAKRRAQRRAAGRAVLGLAGGGTPAMAEERGGHQPRSGASENGAPTGSRSRQAEERGSRRAHVDMRSTRKHADRMPVTIQIRNVPSDLHRKLKARAAGPGGTIVFEDGTIGGYVRQEKGQPVESDAVQQRIPRCG